MKKCSNKSKKIQINVCRIIRCEKLKDTMLVTRQTRNNVGRHFINPAINPSSRDFFCIRHKGNEGGGILIG
jgi:hypothetical protein